MDYIVPATVGFKLCKMIQLLICCIACDCALPVDVAALLTESKFQIYHLELRHFPQHDKFECQCNNVTVWFHFCHSFIHFEYVVAIVKLVYCAESLYTSNAALRAHVATLMFLGMDFSHDGFLKWSFASG